MYQNAIDTYHKLIISMPNDKGSVDLAKKRIRFLGGTV